MSLRPLGNLVQRPCGELHVRHVRGGMIAARRTGVRVHPHDVQHIADENHRRPVVRATVERPGRRHDREKIVAGVAGMFSVHDDVAMLAGDVAEGDVGRPVGREQTRGRAAGADSPARLAGVDDLLGVKRDGVTRVTDLSGSKRAPPSRQDIAGHFVHVQNGSFSATQPYWSTEADVAGTAELLGASDKYGHLLFYAHGGLNAPQEAAIRVAAMAEPFMANGIYPYSVLYDTGLLQTLKDVITGHGAAITQRTGGLLDLTDDLIEKAVGGIGTKLWNEMKADASLPFQPNHDGETALRLFAQHLAGHNIPIHLVGHSTGAVLVGRLLEALDRVMPGGLTIDSVSLMAPACSIDFYRQIFRPRVGKDATAIVKMRELTIYCLHDKAEQDDQVTPAYNKSLLYLVSDAFETRKNMPLLGMEKFHKPIAGDPVTIYYADANSPHTASTTHGGFDNDPKTMNDILRSVLGKKPDRPFSQQDLDF